MLIAISNTPRDYAWGSRTAIAELLGSQPSGAPEAELWLGAHAGSPSRIDRPDAAGGASDLAEWISSDASTTLGEASVDRHGERLPFLLKLLAAGGPLSLQAHPTPEQARAGFERENQAGVPLDAPERNYKDAFHKPELIVALSARFEALCGFRPVEQVRRLVDRLGELDAGSAAPQPAVFEPLRSRLAEPEPLRAAVEWLLRSGRDDAEVAALVAHVVALAADSRAGDGEFAVEFATVGQLAATYPGDPGIVLSLLLNHVSLRDGEALYLPAGNIHAYLDGLGMELMASSDNVLRGGLTPKHIDVDEMLAVLDFSPVLEPRLQPERQAPGVTVFRPDVPDFVLYRVDAGGEGGGSVGGAAGAVGAADGSGGADAAARVALTGPAIAFCTSGSVRLEGAGSAASLGRGEALYITPDEHELAFSGTGTVFIATTGA